MRIALAQINPTVGDIAGNVRKIIDFCAEARAGGAALVVFPELSVIGYPPKDLLLKPQFIDANIRALQTIAAAATGITAVVGYAERNTAPVGRPLHNAVAVLRDGRVVSRHFKTLLPTYDVFDESRYFERGPVSATENLYKLDGQIVGQSICEDLWNDEKLIARRLYHQNPIADLNAAGATLLVNASASPFVVGKQAFREELFGEQVRRFGKPLVYVNQVGGNDELVFDGNSMAFDAEGNVVARAAEFEEDLLIVDLPGETPARLSPASTGIESVRRALVLGLKDYARKCGFASVVLGLSGGIDSALTAALAVEAMGADKVVGVAMPSRFSSGHSVDDAKALATNLNIALEVVPIGAVHDAYERTLAGPLRRPAGRRHRREPAGPRAWGAAHGVQQQNSTICC